MTKTAKFWDNVAKKYAKSPIKNMESYTYTLERTKSYLKPEDKILEIGAGTGSTAIELAPSVEQVTVTDISPEMMNIAKEKATEQNITNIECLTSDALASDLTGPYDVILAHNLLHLVEDLPETIARANALLKPGGLFISKTFCKPTSFGPPLYYIMRLALPPMQLIGKAPFVAFLSIKELEEQITAQGFEIIETANYPVKETRRYIVARKI